MSRTNALISVASAAAMSLAIRFLLCVAQRLTYRARTTVGAESTCPEAALCAADGGGAGAATFVAESGVPGRALSTATEPPTSRAGVADFSACSAAVLQAVVTMIVKRKRRIDTE